MVVGRSVARIGTEEEKKGEGEGRGLLPTEEKRKGKSESCVVLAVGSKLVGEEREKEEEGSEMGVALYPGVVVSELASPRGLPSILGI